LNLRRYKIGGLLLIVLYILPLIVFVLLLFLRQSWSFYHRQELASNYNGQVTVLYFSEQKNIKWTKTNEFVYNGQLYDVVSISTDNNRIKIVCVQDKVEQSYFQVIKTITKRFSLSYFWQVVFLVLGILFYVRYIKLHLSELSRIKESENFYFKLFVKGQQRPPWLS